MIKQIATQGATVTPSDTTFLTNPGTLYVGVSGDLTVIHFDDYAGSPTAVLYKSVPVGFFPVAVRRVNATATTATNIIVNY
jgi:hypothetical protein